MIRHKILMVLLAAGLALGGCSDPSTDPPPNDWKDITSFAFPASLNAAAGVANDKVGVISEADLTISVVVAPGTDVTGLRVRFTTTGVGVRLMGTSTVTSPTGPYDFTNPVDCEVTAQDGSLKHYSVIVTGAGAGGSTYSVTYDGNGKTGGNAPVDSTAYSAADSVTVLGNTGGLVKTGSDFNGWNTQAAGGGTTYTTGQTFTIGSGNVTLYAQWAAAGSGTALSTNVNVPSVLALDTTTTYWIANNGTGYIDFPTTSDTGYGIFVTPNAAISLASGYFSSSWVSNGVGSVNPAGNELRHGFKAAGSDYGAQVSNYSGGTVTFAVIVREGILGASPVFASSVAVSLATTTWIAATVVSGSGYNDFSFVAAGSTATIQLDSLTAGVQVEVLDATKTTTVMAQTIDGTATQVTKTVNVTGLTATNTYVVRINSLVTGSNGASVGQMTITSP
jgi:uncharacterized repeat protein (TIGR02543 family)